MIDAARKLSILIITLAVLSAQVVWESKQREAKLRLFGYLDWLVSSVELINKRPPPDRDTTRTSNDSVAELLKGRWNPYLQHSTLLLQLNEYVRETPLVYNGEITPQRRHLLDPNSECESRLLAFAPGRFVPTRSWAPTGGGYGTGFTKTERLALIVPSQKCIDIYGMADPILLMDSWRTNVYALSVPERTKNVLWYWQIKPARMRTFLDNSNDGGTPPEFEAGRRLESRGLNPMIDQVTVDQLRGEILRLAIISTDKSYATDQLNEAIQDILHQERQRTSLFGLSFGSSVFAVIVPFAYLMLAFSLWYRVNRIAALAPSITADWEVLRPHGLLEITGAAVWLLSLVLAFVPIAWATLLMLPHLNLLEIPSGFSLPLAILTLSVEVLGLALIFRTAWLLTRIHRG